MSNNYRPRNNKKDSSVKGEKADRIKHTILLNPEYSAQEVAKAADSDVSWVYEIADRMGHEFKVADVAAEFAGDEVSDWELNVCEQEFAFLTSVRESLLEGMIHPDECYEYIEDAFDLCFDYPNAADQVGLYTIADEMKAMCDKSLNKS